MLFELIFSTMQPMKSILKKEENGNITLTISIPSDKVKATREVVLENFSKKANIAGFRKGKAPKKIVEEQVNEAQVREEILKVLLPQSYIEAITEHKLKPIMNPKIHVDKLEADEKGPDWQFTAITCEAPEITMGDYKGEVQKITAKGKIVVPGKEEEKPDFNKVMEALLNSVTVKIPAILIDQEVDRLLSQMLDEVKRLGLTLDQYMASTKRTPELLRAEYGQKAESDIKLELALQKIAEEEKITVDEKEVEEAIQKAKDPAEKANLEQNRYLLSSILRQQKTLDFIRNL